MNEEQQQALQVGGARAAIFMVLAGIVGFLASDVVSISAQGVAALGTVVTGASFFLGSLYDAFVRPSGE